MNSGTVAIPLSPEAVSPGMVQCHTVCVVGGWDTLRLVHIFKRRASDILDCSEAGLNILPFNVRTEILSSSFSKSFFFPLELYLYPFPLISSGIFHIHLFHFSQL